MCIHKDTFKKDDLHFHCQRIKTKQSQLHKFASSVKILKNVKNHDLIVLMIQNWVYHYIPRSWFKKNGIPCCVVMSDVKICCYERILGWWGGIKGDVIVVLSGDEVWQDQCQMWNTRCFWVAGFGVFCYRKSLTSTNVHRWHLWLLLISSETFLSLLRGATHNETTLCVLFVVVTSWYNGLCVGDGRLQPRPCSHPYAVILKNWNTTL